MTGNTSVQVGGRTAMEQRLLNLSVVNFVVAMYGLSFLLPVFSHEPPLPRARGFEVFQDCLTERIYPIFTWPILLPNVFLWIGLVCLLCNNRPGALSDGFVAFTGAALVPVAMLLNQPDEQLDLGSGYYLWLGSMGLLAVGSWWLRSACH